MPAASRAVVEVVCARISASVAVAPRPVASAIVSARSASVVQSASSENSAVVNVHFSRVGVHTCFFWHVTVRHPSDCSAEDHGVGSDSDSACSVGVGALGKKGLSIPGY